MKAIRVHKFGDPEVVQVEEVPDPNPGPGQVVVNTGAIGINPRDAMSRNANILGMLVTEASER